MGNTLIEIRHKGEVFKFADGLPLLSLMAVPSSLVQPGYLSVTRDNGILSGDPANTEHPVFAAAYAQLEARKVQGDTAIVSMADYATEMTTNGGGVCGRFAIDMTAKTFRLPCAPGLYWAAVMAGQSVGDYLIDQMRPMVGQSQTLSGRGNTSGDGLTGVFTRGDELPGGFSATATTTGLDSRYKTKFNSASLGSHFNGDRTRPQSWVVDYQMKMYGTVSDAGTIQLANLIAAMTSKLDSAQYEADAPMRVKAWGRLLEPNGTIVNSFGVASAARLSVGRYRITLTNAAPDNNYIVVGAANGVLFLYDDATFPRTTTQFQAASWNATGASYQDKNIDFMVIY